MNSVFFDPWVGPNYDSCGTTGKNIFGKRIMVLGESLYCDGCDNCGIGKAEDGCWTTQKAVNEILSNYNECGNWKTTYIKFERSLVNKETAPEDRKEIWNSLLFYNYLQVAMSDNRIAGTSANYLSAKTPFFEILERYRPQKIIVWGRRLWGNMPGGDFWQELEPINIAGKSERTGCYTLSDGSKVEVISVYHPSVGYSWDYWYKFIKLFLDR